MEKYFKAGAGTMALLVMVFLVLVFFIFSLFQVKEQRDIYLSQREIARDSLAMANYLTDTLQRYIDLNFGQIDPEHPVMLMGRSSRRFPGNAPAVAEPLSMVPGTDSLKSMLDHSAGKGSTVTMLQDGVFRVELSNGFLFDANAPQLSVTGKERLGRIAPVLQRAASNFVIMVQGHTDNQEPQPGAQYPDSWSLSYARAFSVVQFLTEEKQVPSSALVIEACGKFFPLVEQTTEVERAINRRIEIWLIPRER